MPTIWRSSISNYLLDSNLLVYLVHVRSDFHLSTRLTVEQLKTEGARLVFTAQNALEFWSTCTRPIGSGGLGYSIATTETQLSTLQERFELVRDPPSLHEGWLKTVVDHRVKGRQVHDARIAASMRLLGIKKILTKNGKDFKRYSFLEIFDPDDILAGKR